MNTQRGKKEMSSQLTSRNLTVVNQITCRVETPHNKGTGVILKVKGHDLLYLLTAKHCLLSKENDNGVEIKDVKLYIPILENETFLEINLDENSTIFYAPQNIDAAIIKLAINIDLSIPEINILDIKYLSHECLFRGYPQSYGSIKGINIHSVNYVDFNVVTTTVSLATFDSDPLYNCKGFSGSGLFSEVNGQLYLLGILIRFEDVFNRFSICDFSFFSDFFVSNSIPIVEFAILPKNEALLRDFQKISNRSHLVLDGIRNNLGNELIIKREILENDFENKLQKNRLVIIKGVAGVGKSAFAKSEIIKLLDRGYKIIALKADAFAKDSISEVFQGLTYDFIDILNEAVQNQPIVILIDSFEKLLEVSNYEALKELFSICKTIKNVKLILTCRSYAYQQLMFDLYENFPKPFDIIDVPPFNESELENVINHFQFLESLGVNNKFKQILDRPFYLNIVVKNHDLFGKLNNLNEKDLKRLIWEEVISRHNALRAELFEQIAVQRALSMGLFVRISGSNPMILEQLLIDEIITKDGELGDSYCPSHDVFEDIALIRYIERIFQGRENTTSFFDQLNGKQPAIRRAFRLWVNDQLQVVSNNFISFITNVFSIENNLIAQYWKDEIITSILLSNYCGNFFEANGDLLTGNNNLLLIRFIHLLRTTCQEPDEKYIEANSQRTKTGYWIFLKPTGPGWKIIIQYIRTHLDDLKDQRPLVFKLIVEDWSRKIDPNTSLPIEAPEAAEILFHLLEKDIKPNLKLRRSRQERRYSKDEVSKLISVLLSLTEVSKGKIQELIENANRYDRSKGYELRDFHDEIIKQTLSGLSSRKVCEELPDLVCKVAINNWLQKPISEKERGYPFGFESFDPFGVTTSFGLNNNVEMDYFPAGIYKTPIRFLLYFHPVKALMLIVEIFNRVTDVYSKSERGKGSGITEVEIKNNDGSISKQKGNQFLWGMYRGLIGATPDLLESILMSLENWLLELCDIEEKTKQEPKEDIIDFTYTYLLKNSTSVVTTSVLASVAMAHPRRIGKNSFPIIRVKEFYPWDVARLVADKMPLAPMDRDIPFASEERHKFNMLPHRSTRLENLVTQLQVGGYWEEINLILDNCISELEPCDKTWKLALSRMDIRKYRVDESVETNEKGQIILIPELDEDLEEMVHQNQEKMSLFNELLGLSNWARFILEGKEVDDRSYSKWHNNYVRFMELSKIENEEFKPFQRVVHLAAIGVKFYEASLVDEEKNWCINTLKDVVASRIQENITNVNFPNFLDIEPAINTFPLILKLTIDENTKDEIRELIFLSLIFLITHKTEYPFLAVRKYLWEVDASFAGNCLAGMVEFSKLYKENRKHLYIPREKKEEELKQYYSDLQELVAKVCKNGISLKLDDINFKTHSLRILAFSTMLIPLDTQDMNLVTLIDKVFQIFFDLYNEKDSEERHNASEFIEVRQEFQHHLAEFLLNQPKNKSQELFSNFLHHAINRKQIMHDAFEFVKDIVESLIFEEDKILSSRFWDLWEILEKEVKTNKDPDFLALLFLSFPWWNSDSEDWSPLQGKKPYIQKLIRELGKFDIKSVTRLISGIGTATLLPDGIIWISQVIKEMPERDKRLKDSDVFFYFERLIRRAYYRHLKDIKSDKELRDNFLYVLDTLINLGSSLAFIVRERVVSL